MNGDVKPARHIAALDGLRGIAVLAVLLFHFSWAFPDTTPLLSALRKVFWSGWIGVDLFFVLSGYLITRGLVKDSQYSVSKRLKLFWARRAFRIFPLYYIVLIGGTLACFALGQREHVPGVGYWLYFQNYTLAFDPMALRWTAHFWSLAIEEQFYFVWPLFVLFVSRQKRLNWALLLLVASAVARAALILVLPKVPQLHWDAEQTAKLVYRATPTHMDGLLVGALLAMLEADPAHAWNLFVVRFAKPLFYGCFVLFLAMMLWTRGFNDYDRRVMIAGYPLLAVLFSASVHLAANGKFTPVVQRALSRGVFAACGKVSYGMYIFHWVFVALYAPAQEAYIATLSPNLGALFSLALIAGGMGITYGLAVLSFKFVEAPFLTLKEKFHD
jgi:peptidoglycan/LPS O-acetylase OafA/YrhL